MTFLTPVSPTGGKGWVVGTSSFTGFPSRSKTLKKVTYGHKCNLFYILCCHFDESILRFLPRGRVSRQSERVGRVDATFRSFFDILNYHFENYLHTMKLKLQNMFKSSFSFCISKNKQTNKQTN